MSLITFILPSVSEENSPIGWQEDFFNLFRTLRGDILPSGDETITDDTNPQDEYNSHIIYPTNYENLNLHKFSDRLKSFKYWPSVSQSKYDLARCGFIYNNISDQVQCYSCKLIINNWENGADPLQQHILLNIEDEGTCPFLLNTFGQNVIDSVVFAITNKYTHYNRIDDESTIVVGNEIIINNNYDNDILQHIMNNNKKDDIVEKLGIPASIIKITDENISFLITKLKQMLRDGTLSSEIKNLIILYNSMIQKNIERLLQNDNENCIDDNTTNLLNNNNVQNQHNLVQERYNINWDNNEINVTASNGETNTSREEYDNDQSMEITNNVYDLVNSNVNLVNSSNETPVTYTASSSNVTTTRSTNHTEEIFQPNVPNDTDDNTTSTEHSSLRYHIDMSGNVVETTSRSYIDEIFNQVEVDVQMQNAENIQQVKVINNTNNYFVYKTVSLKKDCSTSTSDIPPLTEDDITSNTLKDELKCKVCMMRQRQQILLPCKHMGLCTECFYSVCTGVGNNSGLCPFCREPIQSNIEIFLV